MFSKACEYGIRACIFIAKCSLSGKLVGLKEVSESIDSPAAYTSKILQNLVQNGVIHSEKGPNGGFYIEKDKISVINLSKIVEVIDGNSIFIGCGLGLAECNEKKPCPVHFRFKIIRDELRSMLENTTLFQLTNELHKGFTFLRR